MKLELRPYKLVIYQEGGHFSEHRDSVRGENHIGTLVYILNSEFAGGELVVRRNDTEMWISEPGEWIAMYGDCPHRVNPVTSGTRVSLIFDIYNMGGTDDYRFFDEDIADRCEDGEERHLDADARQPIYRELDTELEKYSDVVICLAHLYPICQAVPSSLKSSDSTLYTLLHDHGAYDLSIVPITVFKSKYERGSNHVTGDLIDLSYVTGNTQRVPRGRTKLIIPTDVSSDEVLHFSEYIHHVGNEPQAEESEYLLTGLCVTKKARSEVATQNGERGAGTGAKRELCLVNDGDDAAGKVARLV